MNIALLITELERGGAERVVAYLASKLDRAEFHVEVISLLAGGVVGEEIKAEGVPVHHLSMAQPYDVRGWFKLGRLLREHQIDILHSHLPAAGMVARMIAPAHPTTKTIYTEHNLLSAYRPMAQWLNCLSLRLPDHIVAVSNTVRENSLHYLCRGCDLSLSVIPNGVEIPSPDSMEADRASARDELGVQGDELLVGTVGNLFERKGQRYLIEACAALPNQPGFKVAIAGHGPLLAELRQLATSLGLAERVLFLGPREDVMRLMAGFDIFALPSLVEGLPMALLEAMSVGLPSVASGVGGVRDVLRHRHTGLVVAPANVAALTRELDTLLTNARMRTAMGKCARADVETVYSADRMAEGYANLYRGMMARATPLRDAS